MKFDGIIKDKVRNLFWYIDNLSRLDYELSIQGNDLLEKRYNFIGLSRTITNQMIYFLINEEISHVSERKTLPKLYSQLWEDTDEEDINRIFRNSANYFSYTIDLFVNQFNDISQAFFFDYSVSMWSAFEESISNIYNEYSSDYKEELSLSHFRKYREYIEKEVIAKSSLSDAQKQEIKELCNESKEKFLTKFPRYITSDDKINYIFKLIKCRYSRDIAEDKKILHLIRALRNTLHNNGVHHGKTISAVIRGHTYELKQGECANYGSDVNIILMFHELLDIYMHILFALPSN